MTYKSVITFDKMVLLVYQSSRDKSLAQRIEVIKDFLNKHKHFSDITNDDISSFVAHLRAKGLSHATINRHLAIISKCVTTYRKAYNPLFALYIPWQKEGKGRLEYLKTEDEGMVLRHLKPDLQLCVKVLLITGMRLGEFTTLELSQVDGDWIRLWKTKTNRPRSLPLPAGTGDQLRQLIARGIPKAHSIRRGLSDALRASGVNSRITPHSLRHTTATRLIKQGVNVLVAGRYLGHNDLKTTQRYVHLEDTDILGAMNKIV